LTGGKQAGCEAPNRLKGQMPDAELTNDKYYMKKEAYEGID
jgi:hypothetical protein